MKRSKETLTSDFIANKVATEFKSKVREMTWCCKNEKKKILADV